MAENCKIRPYLMQNCMELDMKKFSNPETLTFGVSYSEIPNGGGEGNGGLGLHFSERKVNPGITKFFTLPLDIMEETSFHFWKFIKLCDTP